jgi:hypothetical protein
MICQHDFFLQKGFRNYGRKYDTKRAEFVCHLKADRSIVETMEKRRLRSLIVLNRWRSRGAA